MNETIGGNRPPGDNPYTELYTGMYADIRYIIHGDRSVMTVGRPIYIQGSQHLVNKKFPEFP